MENDEPGSKDSEAELSDLFEDGDESTAISITELIDRIERQAFERYVAERRLHRQYSWSAEERETARRL